MEEPKKKEIELVIPIKFEISKPTLTEIPKVIKTETLPPEVGKPSLGQINKE